MFRFILCVCVLLLAVNPTLADKDVPEAIRFATLNVAMGLSESGELARRLDAGDDAKLRALAEVLQRVRPDVVLLNEFDYQADVDAAGMLNANYLAHAIEGLEPIHYPHHYRAPVNTGVDSGLDIDGNGQLGDPGDAWGFGRFPGQYGMLLLSRFPLDTDSVRSFRKFLWSDMPGAQKPANPDGTTFYPEETWKQLRLSSKSHWDVPVLIQGRTIHLLASHPTPPAFDGPEDRNGRRNYDEIRLWADYIDPDRSGYLVDDTGVRGGLPATALFIIAGDLNADPRDGGSRESAIAQLLEHDRVDTRCQPRSEGAVAASLLQGQANTTHESDPAMDTADFSDARVGNLRADYVLPSKGFEISGCGVFWPLEGEPGYQATTFSDHRLVWLDLRLPVPETTGD